MAVINVSITDGADDGFDEGNSFSNTAELAGHTTPPDADFQPIWRWLNLAIPVGAAINSANLKLRARNALIGTITNIHMVFKGHLGNAPALQNGVFSATAGFSPTTAQTLYNPSVWVVDDYYNFNITGIIAEMVAHASWALNNEAAIALLNNGTTGENHLRFYDFADGDAEAHKITIDFSTGGPGSVKQRHMRISSDLRKPYQVGNF